MQKELSLMILIKSYYMEPIAEPNSIRDMDRNVMSYSANEYISQVYVIFGFMELFSGASRTPD